MLIDEIRAEQLAEVFHHYHQTLQESSRGVTAAPAESWNELPGPERDRMIAAARLTLLELLPRVVAQGALRAEFFTTCLRTF